MIEKMTEEFLEQLLTRLDVLSQFKENADATKILERIIHSPHYMTITRESDSKVLFTGNRFATYNFTRLNPCDIIGGYAKKVWVYGEWMRRAKFLEKDGFVNEFIYRGYLRTDVDQNHPQLYEFCANFRRIIFHGEGCILGEFLSKTAL